MFTDEDRFHAEHLRDTKVLLVMDELAGTLMGVAMSSPSASCITCGS